jgi:cold-inducible RNA-binding protein
MNIYVGNLSFQASEEELEALFGNYGEVTSVKIMTDRETGRSRGFAFVEMANDDDARQAIEDLHESEYKTRNLVVNEAKPRTNSNDRPPRRPYNSGGNGGNGGGNGGNRGFRRDY